MVMFVCMSLTEGYHYLEQRASKASYPGQHFSVDTLHAQDVINNAEVSPSSPLFLPVSVKYDVTGRNIIDANAKVKVVKKLLPFSIFKSD